jgi:hypothetical protein
MAEPSTLTKYQFNKSFNDTEANLGNAGVFNGLTRDLGAVDSDKGYKQFNAFAISSHASAANGFKIECSNDGTTWRTAAQVALVADTPAYLSAIITTRYYRVKLTNGATLTTYLMINSSFTKT